MLRPYRIRICVKNNTKVLLLQRKFRETSLAKMPDGIMPHRRRVRFHQKQQRRFTYEINIATATNNAKHIPPRRLLAVGTHGVAGTKYGNGCVAILG